MMKNRFLIIVLISIIFNSITTVAQDHKLFDGKRQKIGFVFSIGGQNLDQFVSDIDGAEKDKVLGFLFEADPGLAVTYTYKVRAFQLQYYYAILREKSCGIDLLAQPQFNTVMFKLRDYDAQEMNSHEFGLNIGVLFRKNFFADKFSIYACISSGPHYVSNAPDRQTAGFLFSDNFFAGMNFKLFKDFYLDTRVGFRHLSNAGIRHPNRGINAIMLSGGFFYTL